MKNIFIILYNLLVFPIISGFTPLFNISDFKHFFASFPIFSYIFIFKRGKIRAKFFRFTPRLFLPVHYTLQLAPCIIKIYVGICVQCYRNIQMPHKVLECLWVHSCPRHVTAINVPANMGSNVWHLHLEDIVISLHCVIESMFPMHGRFRHSIFVPKKKSGIALNH